jgi:uncharacterized membrane protein
MNIPAPIPYDELRKRFKQLRNINQELKQRVTKLDKLAAWITEKVGSMGFFLIILAWSVVWLGWNLFAPKSLRFDPYPGFVLWLFISNMIQLLLMPLIMVGQNVQGEHAEARAEADFEVNTKAELEIETILLHLENQNTLILQVLDELKKKP